MSDKRLSAAEKALLTLGLIALARVALTRLTPSPGDDFPLYCLLLAGQQVILFGLPGLILRLCRQVPRLENRRRKPSFLTVFGIGGTAVVQQCALTLLTLILGQWLAFMGFSVQERQLLLPADLNQTLMALGAFALVPALCEEHFFRGCVDPCLRSGLAPRTSLFVTAGLFALMHGQLAALPAHLAAGLMLTALSHKFGLTAAMAFHFVFNAASLALGLWQRRLPWQENLMAHPPLLLALTGLMLLLGFACGWGLLKELRLKKGEKAPGRLWYWIAGVIVLLLPAYLIELLPR